MAESKSEAEVSAAEQFAHDNRRRHARYQCRGFAEVIVDNACFLFRGSIRDLSQTGCYIKSQARLALKRGTEVELLFTVQDNQFKIPARVMIIRPGCGAGFEFFGDDVRTQNRLTILISRLSSSPPVDEKSPEKSSAEQPQEREVRNLW
jgi:hypothetical protein